MAAEKDAGKLVMRGPDLGRARVADVLDQAGAIHHVGEKEGAFSHIAKTQRRRQRASAGAFGPFV